MRTTLGAILSIALLNVAASRAQEPLLFVRMPSEAPLARSPTEAEIARFVAEHKAHLHMSPQDLLRDPFLAREALGQRRIFHELELFRARTGIAAQVKFVTWMEALRYFADYVSDAKNPPILAQVGDTWIAYFRSLGVVADERRYSWDVRLLWYWKRWVRPEEIADGVGFLRTCRRLRQDPPPGLVAPFAIPTAPGWDLLHDLAVWQYSAGVPSLISTERKWGVLPWRQAVLASRQGEHAAEFLIELVKQGCVALPEHYATEVAEDFLAGRYAMVILGTWVADRAAKRLGADWEKDIGTTLPPKIGAPAATTMKGGSYLVVLDPTRGRDGAGVARARRLMEFLSSAESQERYGEGVGDLPAHSQIASQKPFAEMFQVALERGRPYPEIPEWAPVVENLVTRDNLYAFWKRLSVLAEAQGALEAEQHARERLVLAALHSAEASINSELSPGRLAFLGPYVAGASLPFLLALAVVMWRRQVERRRAERRLRASEAKYRDLYENAPDLCCSVSAASGRIIECNQQLIAKTGYAREELIGRPVLELCHPDWIDVARQAFAHVGPGEHVHDLEVRLCPKDGTTLWASVNVSAVQDERGTILHAIWRDITERKRAEEELRQKQRELTHVARLVTLGEMAASLAHELNQPLAAIVSNAQASQRMLADDRAPLQEVREALSDIVHDSKRASEVIRRLRALLRKSDGEPAPLNLNEAIQEVVRLLRAGALREATTELDLAPDLPPVVGDRVQLQQVIMNLLVNAAEAMADLPAEKRRIILRTEHGDAPGTVLVSVRDFGHGVAEEIREHIFDAFFTTKREGLGMGLSISRSIIEAHGGRLGLTSQVDQGTTFWFTLRANHQEEPHGRTSSARLRH
jgi:PAS domain S-box-containing protein